MERFISICILTLCCVNGIYSQCTADTAVEFVEIPKDQYDETYHDISEDDARPRGYMKGVVVFNDASQNPCVSISNAEGLDVEIMFETVPTMKLCFKDLETQTEVCNEGRHQLCKRAEADSLVYEFYCDVAQGCSESDVTFWYRITKTDIPEDPEGMWCQWRDNDFPGELISLPDDLDLPPVPGDGGDSAATMPSTRFTLLVATVMTTIVIMLF